MGDISTWSPTDNSNTTAPPDGWPEGMAPSAVNNSARAMMGAVRRWYDTVAVQIAGMLPLTGGTLTGTLNAPYVHSTGNVVADLDLGGRDLNLGRNANITGYVSATGDVLGAKVRLADAYVYFSQATGAVNTTGGPLIYADSTNHVYKLGPNNGQFIFQNYAGTSIAGISAAGNLNISSITSAGTITAPTFSGNVSVPASGPVTTGGTVTGGQVTSTGNANVAGTLTTANVSASSNITASGTVTGNSMVCNGTMQVTGQTNLLSILNVGPSGGYARFDGVGSYNVSGVWLTFSGREVKQAIEPYERGLAAIMALRPCAYRYRPELFGAEEAEKVRYGLVADEVAPIVPEMVGEASFGGRTLQTLATGHLSIMLLNACRELAAQNTALAARLALLEAESGATGR